MSMLRNSVLGALVLINGCILLWRAGYFISTSLGSPENISKPSYVGLDYPIMLDVGNPDLVAMTLHESVRFALEDVDDVAVDKTWGTLFANPSGLGRVKLGENNRLLAVTFVHQLHCVRELARAFHRPRSNLVSREHQHHCLNYLRQTLLCDAADTLEEGDFMLRDFEVDRVGGTLVCWDWEKVYDVMGRMWKTKQSG
ncbi:hypothetical protein EDC04DRAFT_2162925 [Pisolithus marmoratus]|nr:hypothetical protein EDC04DRAFT_2162925 [Pisolithus marmoratus]